MSIIRVTLAEVPTDVLVFLVDHAADGPWRADDIAERVAPADVDRVEAGPLIWRALHLLQDGYWAEVAPAGWSATTSGRAAVEKARRDAAGDQT